MNNQNSTKMDPVTLGSLIIGGAGLIQQGIGAFTQARTNKKNYDNELALAKYQTQVQEGLYNKYSSPAALMRQYAEAGLNPNLIYQGAGKGVGNVPTYTAPTGVKRYTDPALKFDSIASQVSQLLNLKQAQYQTEVAKEAVEQQQIKTFQDKVHLGLSVYNLFDESNKRGFSVGNGLWDVPIVIPTTNEASYANYQNAIRQDYFAGLGKQILANNLTKAKWQDQAAYNLYNYNIDTNGIQKYQSDFIPMAYTLAKDAYWDYSMKRAFDKPDKYFNYAKDSIDSLGGLFTKGLSIRALSKYGSKRGLRSR